MSGMEHEPQPREYETWSMYASPLALSELGEASIRAGRDPESFVFHSIETLSELRGRQEENQSLVAVAGDTTFDLSWLRKELVSTPRFTAIYEGLSLVPQPDFGEMQITASGLELLFLQAEAAQLGYEDLRRLLLSGLYFGVVTMDIERYCSIYARRRDPKPEIEDRLTLIAA